MDMKDTELIGIDLATGESFTISTTIETIAVECDTDLTERKKRIIKIPIAPRIIRRKHPPD